MKILRQKQQEKSRKELAPIVNILGKLHTKYGDKFLSACNRYITGVREKRKTELRIKQAEQSLIVLKRRLEGL